MTQSNGSSATSSSPPPPNFLMILVDQLRYPGPRTGDAGFALGIEQILSFIQAVTDTQYAKFFPGFLKLREHAIVFTDHTIAESACIPSRASIMTGQYGPRTGVTQTDGLFKSGDARNFPWLSANGSPTIGDWFRQLGYSTHYFGKWHVSDPPEHTLQGFGFDDWELSWPEPHGSLSNNLGSYRDFQFAALAETFLLERGLGYPYARAVSHQSIKSPTSSGNPPPPEPFFAVCSFTNPHDIAVYPTLLRTLPGQYNESTQQWTPAVGRGPGNSVPIPTPGQLSMPPQQGTFQFELNPRGLPQDCATASATQAEDLHANNKPSAQYDYSVKLGLGLAAKTGLALGPALAQRNSNEPLSQEQSFEAAVKATLELVGIPFQTQDDPPGAGAAFLQYYAFAISLVDQHILKVLSALDQSGLRKSTIVVFCSDHGEYGAAHSLMMEKWHTGYQEALHVPFLVSSPSFNSSLSTPIAVAAQTSHIDVLPTLLGLAHAQPNQLESIRGTLSMTHLAAPLSGADLSKIISSPEHTGPVLGFDGQERRGVLFVTDDMITEPLPRDDDPHNINSWQQYAVYAAAVEELRKRSAPDGAQPNPSLAMLKPGAVKQPNHVRALRSGPFKLVRYCDPWSKKPAADEWELYDLQSDPNETLNLLVHDGAFPTPIAADKLPPGVAQASVIAKAQELYAEMTAQEAAFLSPYPSAHPSAGATSVRGSR